MAKKSKSTLGYFAFVNNYVYDKYAEETNWMLD